MTLVEIGGRKIIKGGNNIARGITDLSGLPDKLKAENFLHVPEENTRYAYSVYIVNILMVYLAYEISF